MGILWLLGANVEEMWGEKAKLQRTENAGGGTTF